MQGLADGSPHISPTKLPGQARTAGAPILLYLCVCVCVQDECGGGSAWSAAVIDALNSGCVRLESTPLGVQAGECTAVVELGMYRGVPMFWTH